ncbi:DUF3732 domain-containing protein [Planctellipticum variicoloris]|uniref:DUF3732 domain-containing protein n=1 Tax=Planctellipticum variicoloris TaxID=3064265 RepID=UPI003013F24D|nr:DUF3732 domain-containing protein [Planctomycetaceae bacterium SH412]
MNVISGASKTGKSAIIPIIDYCLGADKCAIPVETIRNACSWFGVVIHSDEGQKLFARREPGQQKSTSDMFVLEGHSIAIPSEIAAKNTTSDAVKAKLDDLAGLSRLDFDFEKTGSGFRGRPSFRDLMAFTFQSQNIVANPDVLFFKADTYEHREKLKTVFPYVLRAVTPEVLAAKHELEVVSRQLARKERELESITRVSERWQAELRASAVQAREFGLIDKPLPPDASRDDLLDLLRVVVQKKAVAISDSVGVSEAMDELVSLQREESEVDATLQRLRRRLAEMSKLKENSANFRAALTVQRERLGIVRWIEGMHAAHVCPICASTVDDESAGIKELVGALEEVEATLERTVSTPASFDRELLRVKQEFDQSIERLKGITIRQEEVQRRSTAASESQYRATAVSRYLGRLDRALEMQGALADGGSLSDEVETLKLRQGELQNLVGQAGIDLRMRRALERIGNYAGRLLPGLEAERPDDPVELSITDLTIKVRGEQRDDYLWEIGSGANWLSYHVAVSLALQQFFIGNEPNPVPSFVVYDQPSQVYFPRRLARSKDDNAESDPRLLDEDVLAVQKVFTTFARTVAALRGELQVIVLDHAGPEVWGHSSGVHLVEEWRGGTKLVPSEWLQP